VRSSWQASSDRTDGESFAPRSGGRKGDDGFLTVRNHPFSPELAMVPEISHHLIKALMGANDPGGSGGRRRGEERHVVTVRAEVKDASVVTENLSKGGVFVKTDQPFDVGESICVRLCFSGSLEPLELTGIVSWRREPTAETPGGVGVRFDGELSRARAVVNHLLSELADPKLQAQRARRTSKSIARAHRILITEDNVEVALLYRHALRKIENPDVGEPTPLIVDFALNGYEAFQQMCARRSDLLITDLFMPDMDGFRLLAQIRAEPNLAKTKVMVVSGGGPESLQRALSLGADTVMGKPIRVLDFVNTVRTLLGLREQIMGSM
jgi:uncharacterized protein (TIGR02266 family)